jgi:hypothetical protein
MRTFFSVMCALLCLVAIQRQAVAASFCTGVATNLVANCGFETGDFTSWSLSGTDVPLALGSLYGVEGTDPLDGIAPNSGSYQGYFADLDTNIITLSDTIATTPGLLYQISWYLAQDTPIANPFSNQFSASFGATSLTSQTGFPVQGYTLYTFSATATKASTILSFNMGNDLGEFLLDDVVVTTTTIPTTGSPEPGTWLLLLSAGGLSAILTARNRRLETVKL